LAWGPFVGIFIARISRGRTIREFVIFVVGVPTIVSMLWFAAFGGAAIHIEMFGAGGIADKVFADVAGALFGFFEYFPGTTLLNFLAVCLIFIFLVTSADSGTFVISMMTSAGNLNPATKLKLRRHHRHRERQGGQGDGDYRGDTVYLHHHHATGGVFQNRARGSEDQGDAHRGAACFRRWPDRRKRGLGGYDDD
jgi:hypothetical protein